MPCICGHAEEEHSEETAECEVEGCLCALYEPDYYDEEDIFDPESEGGDG
jgi:hypothetical protein